LLPEDHVKLRNVFSEAVFFFMLFPGLGFSRDIPPIISTDWLAQNLQNSNMVILDIRNSDQYKKGHIPGSINVPFENWAVERNGLSLELPSDEALRDLLRKSGIRSGSVVIVVNRNETDFSRSDAVRVAATCTIAGVRNAAVLDGGYTRWRKESRPVSTEPANDRSTAYDGTLDRSSVVSRDYVLSKIGKSIIVDTRTPEDYFGIGSARGHIKSALNLPTPWVFNAEGLFNKPELLRAMAEGVIGKNTSTEIILYCDVGGYASVWWFLLTQMFDYPNAKIYDGSMEEWIKDSKYPVTPYSWH
jgi:thiosulfate/3-mercaptopyruvate sulfurtransferase